MQKNKRTKKKPTQERIVCRKKKIIKKFKKNRKILIMKNFDFPKLRVGIEDVYKMCKLHHNFIFNKSFMIMSYFKYFSKIFMKTQFDSKCPFFWVKKMGIWE